MFPVAPKARHHNRKCALFAGFSGPNDPLRRVPKDRPVTTRLPRSARSALLAAAAAWLALAPLPAAAQGRLEAQYEASLAGIPIGRGTWAIEIGDDSYSAAAQGGTTGLLKTISNGAGTGASQGRVVNGALVPQAYEASTTTSKKSETVHINLLNGNIRDFGIEPVPPVDPDRIPVTDAHKKGVLDPMSSTLVRVPGTGEVVTPEACRAGAAVFDGRLRYELKLDYKRMETVKAEKGYHGPAVVCALYFTPIAGYIPDRPVIKYLAGQRGIEVALVPIAGTRYLVPFRTVIPTPLGTAVLEATHFVTVATPPHVAKTQ
jgi:hypothetical protein